MLSTADLRDCIASQDFTLLYFTNATAAAEALVHLYAQKGHDLHACRRFLKEKKVRVLHRLDCAPITACCVCHTLVLRVFHVLTFPL